MSDHFWKDYCYRVCSYTSDKLIATKYCKTKDEAIKYFNACCAATSSSYWYEIWDDVNSTLLFSTEE